MLAAKVLIQAIVDARDNLVYLELREHTRDTLFPYTTLFRSAGALVEGIFAEIARGLVARGVRRLVVAGGETSGAVVQATTSRDRKSTRLNSSHRCISYAVFCLKKKTKEDQTSRPHFRRTHPK